MRNRNPGKISRRQALKTIGGAIGVAGLASGFGIAACSPRRADAGVIVVGAGLAGLNAAILLQDQGLDVLVLEASQRAGGRVHTLDKLAGHPEAGGSEIGADYARVLDMLTRIGKPDMVAWLDQVDPNAALNIGGTMIAVKDWPTSSQNRLAAGERALPPIALTKFFLPKSSPLADLASWLEPAAREFDVPFGAWLKQQGAGDEALRLISRQVPSATLDGTSTLWMLRNQRIEKAAGGIAALRRIKDGASRLPEGMAALLKREIRFDVPVVGIRSSPDGVEVKDSHGKVHRASYAVCTLPMSMAREILFEPALPALQSEAFAKIPQGDATSVFFNIKAPYWDEDGMPAGFWSDRTGWVLRYNTAAGSYLWMFKDGSSNAAWRALDDATILAQATGELTTARPSTRGRIEASGVFNWSRYPWLRGGNGYRAPGDISRYANVMANAHDRIHFAGVDTAVMSAGMEGAMESGERAALEILQRQA